LLLRGAQERMSSEELAFAAAARVSQREVDSNRLRVYRWVCDSRRSAATRCCTGVRAGWSPASWREKLTDQAGLSSDVHQNAQLPAGEALEAVERKLAALPVLVSPGEIVSLRAALANAAAGRSFVVHAGDDRAGDRADGPTRERSIEGTFRLLVAQVILLTYLSGLPSVKIGFVERSVTMADCLSDDQCVTDGSLLASASVKMYSDWAMSLNMLRAIAKSTGSMMDWVDLIYTQLQAGANASGSGKIEEFEKSYPKAKPLLELVTRIDEALRFVTGCGVDVSNDVFREPEFYTSMDLSSLWYEQAFTRTDATYGSDSSDFFMTSAHLLVVSAADLIHPNSPYLEFARGIYNPIAVRIDCETAPSKLTHVLEILNPENISGRVVLVAGMGAREIWQELPNLIGAVQSCSSPDVVWTCDPMWANNIKLPDGAQSPSFGLILAEIDAFFSICRAEGVAPGGLHLNMTSEEVKEVFGGAFSDDVPNKESSNNAITPRLNGLQALEIAYEAGHLLRHTRS